MKTLEEKIRDLLNEYNHNNTSSGVEEIISTWRENKANLINTLSKHPNWDADNYRIVFSENYNRPFNRSAIGDFTCWASEEYKKIMTENYVEPTIEGKGIIEYKREVVNLSNSVDYLYDLNRESGANGFIIINGVTMYDYIKEYERRSKLLVNTEEKYVQRRINGDRYYLTCDANAKYESLHNFLNRIGYIDSNIVDEDFAKWMEQNMPEIPCAEKTRIMKIIGRVCKAYGLDKIVDMKTTSWYSDDGQYHEREKDMGYNGQIAKLGDAINPLQITRHTIISVNPLDYLTMSFGNGWASCHTIDKENIRGGRSSYEGQYCSGTLSYMLDESSVIFYTVDSSFEGNAFEEEDKINRVMFHFNEDYTSFVEGRIYPDGRDGGDQSLSAQFRNVMQKVITECTDHNNLWRLIKGTVDRNYVSSKGTNYQDYFNYSDCTLSLLKGIEEYPRIRIGHNPICPNCGEEHTRNSYLCCDECQGEYDHHCYRCGDGLNEDDGEAIYCDDNGNWYCCWRCAEADDLRYCEDDERWHDEWNYFYEEASDRYYHHCSVETEDGTQFHSRDAAIDAGYDCTSDDEWYPEDEIVYDEQTGRYFHLEEDTININGNYYEDEDSARDAGYLEYEGEWYSEDDMWTDGHTGECFPDDLDGAIETVDDNHFINEENARAEGYERNEDGDWLKTYREEEVA